MNMMAFEKESPFFGGFLDKLLDEVMEVVMIQIATVEIAG